MPKSIAFRPTESLEENLFNEVSESGKDISKVIKKRLEDLIYLKHLFETGAIQIIKEKINHYDMVRLDEI